MGLTVEQYNLVLYYLQQPYTDYNIQVKTGISRYYIKKIRNGEPVPIIGNLDTSNSNICKTPLRRYNVKQAAN